MDHPNELAARWGIETAYYDVQGRRHEADGDVLRRVAEALSAGGATPAAFPAPPQPRLAYQGDGRRTWVLAVQLYGVRSRRNWGHGDFTDLAELLKLVGEVGGAGIGLNPLHALFYDRPGSCSPYSPNSRLFLNPLYIDVEALEEFGGSDSAASAALERLRASPLVDYPAVAELKLAALRVAYWNFTVSGNTARRQDFVAYRSERGRELEYFATFETLRGKFPTAWQEWPEEWRQSSDQTLRAARAQYADEIGFHEYLQWNAERQLGRCRTIARERGLSIGLYLDTAVGVDAGGADAWMEPGAMLRGLSVGAPPDQYNTAGQDWGITAYNPHGLISSDYAPFRHMLRAAMRHAGAVRIDHVLGLMRLFVVPHGLSAGDGVYLRLPFEAMLTVVVDESLRWQCITIGEDLGTVPENFRATLSAWGVWSYLVMLFERNADGSFRPPSDYPEKAIATLNTHDLPSFAGWMSGHDLQMKRGIGLDPGETDEERERARVALRAAAGEQARFEDIVAFLAATPTRLVSVSIEDVLDVSEQINVPGTVDQHPNWRQRWPLTVEELAGDQRLRRIAATLARAGRGSSSA